MEFLIIGGFALVVGYFIVKAKKDKKTQPKDGSRSPNREDGPKLKQK